MRKDVEKVFRELKEDVSMYAELKLELIKINAYERISKVIAVLSYGLLLSVLVFIALLFVMLTFGFLFSKWLHSIAAGIGIVAAFYLILTGVVIANKDRISLKVINLIVSALNAVDRRKDTTTHSELEDENPDPTEYAI